MVEEEEWEGNCGRRNLGEWQNISGRGMKKRRESGKGGTDTNARVGRGTAGWGKGIYGVEKPFLVFFFPSSPSSPSS